MREMVYATTENLSCNHLGLCWTQDVVELGRDCASLKLQVHLSWFGVKLDHLHCSCVLFREIWDPTPCQRQDYTCQMLLLQIQFFLLQLLSKFPCATLLTKCPLKVITEEKKEFNYYKPGYYLISGITSGMISQLYPYVFSKPPTHRLKR